MIEISSNEITVIQMVSSITKDSYGLGYAALNLAAAIRRSGVNVYLASIDKELDAYEACEEAGFPRERYIRGLPIGHSRLRLSPFLLGRLLKISCVGRPLIHMHGMWTYASYIAGTLRDRWRCPFVLSPHGSLEPYALKMSMKKKTIAQLLYERRNVMQASCVCALSEQEKSSIRAYGFTGRIEIMLNGVNQSTTCSVEDVVMFRNRHSIGSGTRIILFLSRIARKKNLPLLLRVFSKISKLYPGWILVIAGDDEGGHLKEIQSLIQMLNIQNMVRLTGPLSGKEKACAYTSASLFVLPSLSEGLPISVLEAMEYGKPVLVTDGWTLPVAASKSFEWRVPVNEGLFEVALAEAMGSSEGKLVDMGRTARSLIRDNFSWETIAERAYSLYLSILNGR